MTKQSRFLLGFFLAGFFCQGLFYENMACLFSAGFGILFCVMLLEKKPKQITLTGAKIAFGLLLLFYFLTCFWAVDWGMSLIGAVRLMGVMSFALCLELIKDEERTKLLSFVPYAALCMIGLCAIGFVVPVCREKLFVANRMGGFFQYPNVFALFCLVGFLLLRRGMKEKEAGKHLAIQIAMQTGLLLGILLSGSRTVTLLAVPCILAVIITQKEGRKETILMLAGIVLLATIIVLVTGNVQNIGRVMTTSLSSSTLLGRILYAKDAILKLLSKHQLGLGYLGYSYAIKPVQTGVYTVRFLHNDYLQLMVDIGIVPAVLGIVYFIKTMFHFKKDFFVSLSLLAMGLHMLVDFDVEFVAMLYLLVLLCKENGMQQREKAKVIKVSAGFQKSVCAAGILASAICLWLGIGTSMRYIGNAELSAKLVPFYTEANEQVLSGLSDIEAASALAQKIQKQNEYVQIVYDTNASVCYLSGAYEQMWQEKEKSCLLTPYDMENHNRYGKLLQLGMSKCFEEGKQEQGILLMKQLSQLPNMVNQVKENTDPIAYRIKDVPDFTLDEELMESIEEAGVYLKKVEPNENKNEDKK